VRCYTACGELLGKIHIPETVANLCFGGQQRNTTLHLRLDVTLCRVHECTGRYEAMIDWRIGSGD
jgi:hypothetical protein